MNMNIKRFYFNTILLMILMNGIPFLLAAIHHETFQFDWIFGLVTPMLGGLASAFVRTPTERRQLQ